MIIKNLKDLRKNKGLSQVQCSEEIDIPLRTLQRYEHGENIGDTEYLCKIMKYYNLCVSDITDF